MKQLSELLNESLLTESILSKELKFSDNIRKTNKSKIEKVYDEVWGDIEDELERFDPDLSFLYGRDWEDLVSYATIDTPGYLDEIEDEIEERIIEDNDEWFYNIILNTVYTFDMSKKSFDKLDEVYGIDNLISYIEQVFRKIYK